MMNKFFPTSWLSISQMGEGLYDMVEDIRNSNVESSTLGREMTLTRSINGIRDYVTRRHFLRTGMD